MPQFKADVQVVYIFSSCIIYYILNKQTERVKIGKKYSRIVKKLKGSEEAVSPLIGVVLMVGLTVSMVSVIAVSVLAAFTPIENPPQAKIVVVVADGDLNKQLFKNFIILKHKGGDALINNNTKIIFTGKGYAYAEGADPFPLPAWNIRVTYRDITGKNYYHDGSDFRSKQIVSGTSWDAGESIELYGRDGINIGDINQGNTVDNKWKFEAGSTVSVTVIDIPTNRIIATSSITVKKT